MPLRARELKGVERFRSSRLHRGESLILSMSWGPRAEHEDRHVGARASSRQRSSVFAGIMMSRMMSLDLCSARASLLGQRWMP